MNLLEQHVFLQNVGHSFVNACEIFFFLLFPEGKGKHTLGRGRDNRNDVSQHEYGLFFGKSDDILGGGRRGGGFNVFPSCVSKKCNAEKGRMFVMVCYECLYCCQPRVCSTAERRAELEPNLLVE
jgi:hypothetical protein